MPDVRFALPTVVFTGQIPVFIEVKDRGYT